MSTIEAKAGTILDIANSIGPDGNLLAVAETLYKEIPIFQDAVWTEANDTLMHRYARTAKLPTSEHIRLNKGVGGDLGYNSQHSPVCPVARIAPKWTFASLTKARTRRKP